MPPGSVETADLFSGMHFVFFVRAHMSRMMQRVQELGGTIDDSLTPETTHVVCALDTDERSVQERLPASRSLQLVTPEFISRSIITHSLQNEENFRPKFSRDRPASRQSMVGEDLGDSEREDRPAKRQKVDQGSAQHGPTHAASGPVAPNAQSHKATTDLATPGPVKGEGRSPRHPADRTAPPAGTSPSGPCKVVRRGAEWVAVQGSKPAFTGGHTGIPWGSCGVWDEPYDEALARETVEKLKQYWYTTKGELPPGEENGSSRAEGEGNGVCGHVACSKRPYCLVVRLGEVKKVYLEGRDHFQIKAIERAQTQLAAHRQPLDTDADVDAVGLGTKSTQKVKEILKKGHSSRVAAAAKDERAVAIAALMQMWGVGPGIAERWYALGCRTIDEVRGKVDAGELKLTEQQRVGLKYFADLQVAIPRAEIAEAEATVREATFELAERLGATDAELTYCFATGSYRRGKPESSDIDILIVLPPSLVGHPCGDFLHALLTVLLRSGLLLDELDPKGAKAAHHSPVRASWMGVCRPPCSPAVRRIDFKIYGPRGTACAVNYFANSMAFCRATRFWANNNVLCAEAAKSFNPAANGFKISDLEFSPILKKHARELSRGQESITVLGPPIEIENETQLFETLGLAYVPVTMRFFQDFH